MCLWPSGVPACGWVVLSLSLLCVRWLVLCGVGCWAWLSSAVSWWILVSCFRGAVLVWPHGPPPCGSAWCVLVFRCPVLCSVALCCRVVVCCRALPFVCVVASACCLFLATARLLCVFWGVLLCVPCPPRPVRCGAVLRCAGTLSLCCARRLCCFWWLVLLVPGVAAFFWGSAGGSGCPALSFGGVCRLWCPCLVWPSLGVFPVVSCSPVLCPFALCCRVVLCCGALSPFFCFSSLLLALVSCCSPLVLGSGLVPAHFCLCPLPVRCCAGVPAPLLSVRWFLALAGLAGVLCCCLLWLRVCCWAWLSSVVTLWILVAPGVVSRCCAVVCPWVLCCAVLLRGVPPGVALLCAVLFRFALFGAAARRVVSWGAVRCLGVPCLLFLLLFLAFENKKKLYTTQQTRVQQDHVRCSFLRATRRS